MALWSIKDMADAMDAELIYQGEQPPLEVLDLSIDTRSLKAGDAFFAITGLAMDGHKFVKAAEENGAAVAIVERKKTAMLQECQIPFLVVEDCLQALEDLAKAARARTKAKIVAITGSVGKTTTKEIMRHVLSQFGKVHASPASFNNHWGVPLTLARMPKDCDFGVFEIGMNHPNEITPLVAQVKPHVATITNVAAAHLGAFKDLRDIAKAKAEIFSGLLKEGTAIINGDDEQFEFLMGEAKSQGILNIISFGKNKSKDCTAQIEEYKPNPNGSCVKAKIKGEGILVKIGMLGEHIAMNAMAALLMVDALGLDMARGALQFADLSAEKGRGARHELQKGAAKFLLIDESYNANPASMLAALTALGATKCEGIGRKIAILGDMLELGDHSKSLHEELAKPIKTQQIDLVHLVGDEMKALFDVLPATKRGFWGQSVDEILTNIVNNINDGDVIMVKASNSLKFAELVTQLTQNFAQNN